MLVDVFVICSGPGAHNPNHDQLMKPVHVITGKNTKKQSVRQTEHNKKKTSIKIEKKKKIDMTLLDTKTQKPFCGKKGSHTAISCFVHNSPEEVRGN